jgi:uncharacterized Zn finger protein
MSYYNSRYDDRWPAYVPVAERRRKAALAMEKLSKKGHKVAPVKIEGRAIATTFWGKAWCDNLERYSDYASRIERGRTYVRNGSVVDLQIAPREVTAMVSGSELYKIKVSINEVGAKLWASICKDCAGGIDSLVELLQGRFSKGVMERICRQDVGLFPKPAEIHFSCSCPDHASMCKHVAAVLYGVGARLDQQPELLFRLRAVNETDLLAHLDTALPLAKGAPEAGKVLADDDLSALFGLDMDTAKPTVEAGDGKSPARRKPDRTEKPVRAGTPDQAGKPAQPEPSAAGSNGAARKDVRPSTQPVTAVTIPPKAIARKGNGSPARNVAGATIPLAAAVRRSNPPPKQAPAAIGAAVKRTTAGVAPSRRRARPTAT